MGGGGQCNRPPREPGAPPAALPPQPAALWGSCGRHRQPPPPMVLLQLARDATRRPPPPVAACRPRSCGRSPGLQCPRELRRPRQSSRQRSTPYSASWGLRWASQGQTRSIAALLQPCPGCPPATRFPWRGSTPAQRWAAPGTASAPLAPRQALQHGLVILRKLQDLSRPETERPFRAFLHNRCGVRRSGRKAIFLTANSRRKACILAVGYSV
jgi:hypothetical protein